MARSRNKSSAFGELIQSVSCAVGNSVPITGVTSICSNWSNEPDALSGLRCSLDGRDVGSTSIADGAILMNVEEKNCDRVVGFEDGNCVEISP